MADMLRLALDPAAFATELLGFVLDPWQADALRWPGKRLLLNCARQSGKSTMAAILGLHRALYYPGSLVLLVSPSLRQSSELFKKVSDQLDKLDTPPALVEDNKLSMTMVNRSRVVSLPSSEATIRGFSGANLIIEDEAARAPEATYKAVRPMLAVSGGKLILMSTPWGRRGHFWDAWDHGAAWKRVMVTAEQCPRIPAAFLAEERETLGDWWYFQEYFCLFQDSQTAAFTFDDIQKAFSGKVKEWKL